MVVASAAYWSAAQSVDADSFPRSGEFVLYFGGLAMILAFERLALLVIGLVLILSCCSTAQAARAAIIRTDFRGESPALVEAVTNQIAQAGYTTLYLNSAEMCDSAMLSAESFDLLVLPNAAVLPVKAAQSILNFARAGGDIIALNAPLWQRMLIEVDGNWTTREHYQRARAGKQPDHLLFDFKDIKDWVRTSNDLDLPTVYNISDGPASGAKALHAAIPKLTGWDTFGIRNISNAFPEGDTLTVFSAKGTEQTTQLMVEWSEKDGSRWIAVVPLYPEWRQYALAPKDFKYWHSVEERGGRGDSFKPQNASSLSFGLAQSHTGGADGKQEYWVGLMGTSAGLPDLGEVLGEMDLPALDILSPGYKFFDVQGQITLSTRKDQAIISTDGQFESSQLRMTRSPHPRPTGAGFDKRRNWRWIPLVEAKSGDGQWRGAPVAMMVNADGACKGGVWASFGFGRSDIYLQPDMLSVVGQVAKRMREGAFILDGGANFFTYFEDQDVELGVRVTNVASQPAQTLSARVIVTSPELEKPAIVKQWKLTLQPGETKSVSSLWRPDTWPDDGFTVTTELIKDGKVIDTVAHSIHVWHPRPSKQYMTGKNGEFSLNGKRWRAHGVNYMPSSGIGIEDGEYFEHWIGARSYDPEVIDRDLDHIQNMGLNSVSIFIYTGYEKDQNLLDLLRKLEKRGLKANLGLRPGMPLNFNTEKITGIIKHLRLDESDTIFAYDIAWEPMFGTQDKRTIYDKDWERWIIERYGSVAQAEEDWEFELPRNKDHSITNPLPHQIDTDGRWRKMTAAYRRFLDTLLYKIYGKARQQILEADPHHMVSFRMAEAGNPNYRWDGRIPYDWPYLGAAMDTLQPEAYGRIGDWERVKPGWFEYRYAKWAAPAKPTFWAEMGVSTWELSRMRNTKIKSDRQVTYYEAFYRMLNLSGASGVFFWWYPGGFRYGENSDYGIINPDGTDRPVTKIIRENAEAYINGPTTPNTDYWIEIDRDEHPDGIAGIYDEVKGEFWAAVDKGRSVGLRTSGTGSTSANCPLLAVGNGPLTGSNPPKYLDAAIDSVKIKLEDDNWEEVDKEGTIRVDDDKPVIVRVEFTNLGEAKLLTPWGTATRGVYLRIELGSSVKKVALDYDVLHQTSSAREFELAPAGSSSMGVTITFEAEDITKFGERFGFVLAR